MVGGLLQWISNPPAWSSERALSELAPRPTISVLIVNLGHFIFPSSCASIATLRGHVNPMSTLDEDLPLELSPNMLTRDLTITIDIGL